MKKSGLKHLFRSIKKNLVSFVAVSAIVAVSIAIFQGFQSTGASILMRADEYFEENHLQNFEIACANGITQEDIDTIAGWDGVNSAEGGYSTSVIMNTGSENLLVQARSLLDTMDLPVVVKGTLPAAADEVAIEEKMMLEKGISVGEYITLEQDGCLVGDTFLVTAIINQPSFSSAELVDARGSGDVGTGVNDYYVALTRDAFDADYFSGCYTTAYVDCSSLDGVYFFSDEYADGETEILAQMEPLAAERAQLRYEELQGEVQTEIDDAQAEIDDAQAEIDANQLKLDDARAEIDDAQAEIDSALAEIAENEASLADAEDELDQQERDLIAAYGGLGAYQASIDAARAGIEASREQIERAKLTVADAEAELEASKTEFAQSEQELEDAKLEIADARAELEDAKAEAAELQPEDWIISGRNSIGDIRGVKTVVDSIYGLSYALSVIFLLVAVVICFAAVSRVIQEQRVLVGAQKALGFTGGEIFRHYLMYNMLCALLGIVLGWIFSVVIVENLALGIFQPKFVMGEMPHAFTWISALIAAGISIVLFIAATYLTCAKLIKEPATELMRGEVPVQGKALFFEKLKFYQKANLYTRTMIKNALNDKSRLMTTVTGLVGCTALLVSCFSMNIGMENAPKKQFEKYSLYDYCLEIDTSTGSADEFAEVLDGEGIANTLVQDKLKKFRVDGGSWETVHAVTTSDYARLSEFMNLVDYKSGKPLGLPERGMLVSRRVAENNGVSVGDTVELMDANGRPQEFVVSGVFESYLPYHMFVMSDAYYESAMGESADPAVFLISGDVTGLEEKVQGLDGFVKMHDNAKYKKPAAQLDMVIVVCTVLSAVMSVLVLFNQIATYINRKARELAVMRINGYTMRQTKAYVYKDNVVLIVLGLFIGCAVGVLMSYIDIRIIETSALHFIRTPSITACLLSAAIGAVFALIVNFVALRKINNLNLTNVSSN